MKLRYILDEQGDNLVTPGYHVIEDEVSFLREALGGKPLFIRGTVLCQWAEDLCRAREWPFTRLSSPSAELRIACPELSDEEARALVTRIGSSLDRLERPLKPCEVAATIWPEDFWGSDPGAAHAAKWLTWFAQARLSREELLLVHSVAQRWQAASEDSARTSYAAMSSEEAWSLLKQWLRVSRSAVDWPLFPLPSIPPWILQRLREEWTTEAVTSRGAFFASLLKLTPSKQVLNVAAEVAARYYRNNRSELSHQGLQLLIPYLSGENRSELQKIIPPEDPGDVPEELGQVVHWFRDRYLGFRQWVAEFGQEQHRERLREVARKFGLWYLRFYAQARVNGPGAESLSWSKAARLSRSEAKCTLLLVVLDGLGYQDAMILLSLIQEKTRRLSVDFNDIVLAPLPTITGFAKAALLTGVHPARAFDEEQLGSLQTKDSEVIHALADANPGEMVIWSLTEPDRTYHSRNDWGAIKQEVEGRLLNLAVRIANVVHAVPDEHRLRVVITTDHGRLMAFSQRTQPVPDLMQAHGRAAWGPTNRQFPAEGFVAEGNVVYLHPDRFGLPSSCAILLTDEVFYTSDGRAGSEPFPHGGVYPEEVLVPWIQMTRDREPIRPMVSLTGGGVSQAQGHMRLEVVNPSDLPIHLLSIELGTNGHVFSLNEFPVSPMKKEIVGLEWGQWPSPREVKGIQATLRYRLPAGDEQHVSFSPVLESEEMYTTENILGDLGEEL